MDTSFVIKYDFKEKRKDPQDVFKSISIYVEAYCDYTDLLSEAMGVNPDSKLVLSEVEKGSIKSVFERVAGLVHQVVDVDNAARLTFEEWTEKDDLGNRRKIAEAARKVESQLEKDNPSIPIRPKIDEEKFAYVIEKIKAANDLTHPDECVYIYDTAKPERKISLNSGWKFSIPVKKMFEKDVVYHESNFHLEPVVAAFRGNRAWRVYISELSESVDIKIEHQGWLERYQKGFIRLGPRYSIYAKVSYNAVMTTAESGSKKVERLESFKLLQVIKIYPSDNHQYDLGTEN